LCQFYTHFVIDGNNTAMLPLTKKAGYKAWLKLVPIIGGGLRSHWLSI
jgi:hypothetical protein